jgi:hypothetical protein
MRVPIGVGLPAIGRGFNGRHRGLPVDRVDFAQGLRPGARADARGERSLPARETLHARTRTEVSRASCTRERMNGAGGDAKRTGPAPRVAAKILPTMRDHDGAGTRRAAIRAAPGIANIQVPALRLRGEGE